MKKIFGIILYIVSGGLSLFLIFHAYIIHRMIKMSADARVKNLWTSPYWDSFYISRLIVLLILIVGAFILAKKLLK